MIIEEIDKSILGQSSPAKVRNPIVFWPSQAMANSVLGPVGSCIRKNFYSMKGVQPSKPYSPRMLRIFEIGKKVETMELDWAKAHKDIYLDDHFSFEHKYKNITIRGELDGVFKYQDKPIGIEYKTGWGYTFRNEVFGDRSGKPFPRLDNLLQVMIYLDALKNDSKYPITFFALIYTDRGSCEQKEFAITLNQEGFPIIDGSTFKNFSITDIYDKFILLQNYLEVNQIPQCDFTNYYSIDDAKRLFRKNVITRNVYEKWIKSGEGCDWQCEHCIFRDRCKMDSDTNEKW